MRRTTSTTSIGLALAAVPLLLSGCSASPEDDRSGTPGDAKPSVASSSPAPSLPPARFTGLPKPCTVLSKGTVGDLVPKAKDAGGDPGKSSDTTLRASCSWNGLKGFQYRWLEVSFDRSESVPGVGSAEARAKAAYARLKTTAAVPDGLKDGKAATIRALQGLGDEAQLVSATVEKDGDDYRNVTIIARTANVVVTVSYDGAGFEGSKPPKSKDIEDGAVRAAKESLKAVK